MTSGKFKLSSLFKKLDFRKKTNDELIKTIKISFVGIILTLFLTIITFVFFGPYVGKLFGLLSKFRNAVAAKGTIAPPPPTFYNTPVAVKENKVAIQGFSTSGNTIKVYVNGPEKHTVTADADGKFTIPDIQLLNGKNSIYAKAYDKDNLESQKSETLSISVDREKPKIELINLKEGTEIKHLNDRIIIKGIVNEKAKITINERSVILRPDFSFEYILGAKPGTVELKISAVDEASNEEKLELKVKYKKDN